MSYIDDFLAQQPMIATSEQLANWQPDSCGKIDMRIARNGDWYHNGDEIQRKALVRLFASVLRHDEDLGYVLVTPVEKCEIDVEDVPFIAVLVEKTEGSYRFAINVGLEVSLSSNNPIEVRNYEGQRVPYIKVRDNLWARCSRNVYYDLAEEAEERSHQFGIEAAGQFWSLE